MSHFRSGPYRLVHGVGAAVVVGSALLLATILQRPIHASSLRLWVCVLAGAAYIGFGWKVSRQNSWLMFVAGFLIIVAGVMDSSWPLGVGAVLGLLGITVHRR